MDTQSPAWGPVLGQVASALHALTGHTDEHTAYWYLSAVTRTCRLDVDRPLGRINLHCMEDIWARRHARMRSQSDGGLHSETLQDQDGETCYCATELSLHD